jgi:uncharacterized GH25 family protein
MLIAKLRILIVGVVLICGVSSVAAHEFWVEPQPFTVQPDAQIVFTLRVGEMMRGKSLPFHSSNFQSLTITTRNGTRYLNGIEDDIAALSYTAGESGLHVIAYHSTANQVTFDDWETFRDYVSEEGLDEIAKKHRARNLPDSGFKEDYTRYAKALVQVGPAGEQDRDAARGLPLELVAEDNPYVPGLETVRVKLLSAGKPVPGRQITVFRYDGAVSRSVVNTDARGQAAIPVASGGLFLLNAIDLQPVEDQTAVWSSYWASLTFGLPVVLRDVHPLDPLSKKENARAIRAIAKSGYTNPTTRAALVTLAEPSKADVLAWTPGEPAERRAFAIIRNGMEVFEATVDLAAGTIDRWQQVPGVQPPIQSAEWARAQRLIKKDPRWIAAMRARGYDDFSQIFCESLSAGFFDLTEERGRRLLKMPCYDISGTKTNIYGRPIEGRCRSVRMPTASTKLRSQRCVHRCALFALWHRQVGISRSTGDLSPGRHGHFISASTNASAQSCHLLRMTTDLPVE